MLLQNLGRKYGDLEQTVVSTYASTNLKRPAPSRSSLNGPASVTLAEIIEEAVPMPPNTPQDPTSFTKNRPGPSREQ